MLIFRHKRLTDIYATLWYARFLLIEFEVTATNSDLELSVADEVSTPLQVNLLKVLV